MGKELIVSSYGPHFGEERVLVGRCGSGTIFLTGCNLLCVYCQNYEISHLMVGDVMGEETVAGIMLHLQQRGCHNINFVTPTHFAPHLVKALRIAAKRGLQLPIVWNCSGYENVEVIALLKGIVDIYMPDIKYGAGTSAKRYSNASDYFARCAESVREMHRQVDDLKVDATGVAYRGLMVRHLVLPDNLAGSDAVLTFLRDLSRDTYVNIMDQYRPKGGAWEFRELSRPVTREEYARVLASAKRLGLTRLDSIAT
jgi:putative pyruvate formate lyase activating enzyme